MQTASYLAPTISRLSPQVVNTYGNSPITIQGKSFGYFDASAVITVGRSLCSPTAYTSDSSLRCRVQSGAGAALNVSVQIGNQVSTAFGIFSYLPPQLSDASPRVLNTTGGVLTVTGQNFGYAIQDQRVFVGSTVCSSASPSPWISGHSESDSLTFFCVESKTSSVQTRLCPALCPKVLETT